MRHKTLSRIFLPCHKGISYPPPPPSSPNTVPPSPTLKRLGNGPLPSYIRLRRDTVRVSSVEIQISRRGVSPAPRIDISVTASRIFQGGPLSNALKRREGFNKVNR